MSQQFGCDVAGLRHPMWWRRARDIGKSTFAGVINLDGLNHELFWLASGAVYVCLCVSVT